MQILKLAMADRGDQPVMVFPCQWTRHDRYALVGHYGTHEKNKQRKLQNFVDYVVA